MINNCCNSYPVQCVPAYWGNEKISPDADYSIYCKKCGREVHGDTDKEAKENWNSIDMNKINKEQIRRNDALKIELMAKDYRLEDDEEQPVVEVEMTDIERRITANEADHPYLYACQCGFESNTHMKCIACDDGFLVRC